MEQTPTLTKTNGIGTRLKRSSKHLKQVNALAITAILIAIGLVLDRFLRVQITPEIRIGLGFIASGLIGMMFGPVMGGVAGLISDLLSAIISLTGAFFPGFTLSAILGGVFYGAFLYQHKFTFWRVLLAKAFINVFINIGLNSVWVGIMTGKAVYVLIGARIAKNLILLPIEAILLYIVGKFVLQMYKRVKLK